MNDRNKPCLCGSGIKTKKCCKSPEVIRIKTEEIIAASREMKARNSSLKPTRYESMMLIAAIAAMSGNTRDY